MYSLHVADGWNIYRSFLYTKYEATAKRLETEGNSCWTKKSKASTLSATQIRANGLVLVALYNERMLE